jgi:hypothetical protein
MARGARSGVYTMRSTSGVVAFWIAVVVLVAVVGTTVVRGDWGLFAFVLPPSLLMIWLLWLVLYRPVVRYDDTRVTVTNIGRVHVMPWARVTGVRQRFGLEFSLEGVARPLTAWAVPPPRRPGNIASALDRRSRTEHDPDAHARVLEGFREGAAPSDDPVVHRWDLVPLVIGAVLVVAVVLEFAIGI